jgi:hypothetical protein
MAITKEQLAEWEQREAAYYAEAEKWKHLQEKMKREHNNQLAEWIEKDKKIQEMKYSEEEIKEAIHQIRIDRLKIILNPYVR